MVVIFLYVFGNYILKNFPIHLTISRRFLVFNVVKYLKRKQEKVGGDFCVKGLFSLEDD